MLAYAGNGGIWMDEGLGWRAVLLLDRREGITRREERCYYQTRQEKELQIVEYG